MRWFDRLHHTSLVLAVDWQVPLRVDLFPSLPWLCVEDPVERSASILSLNVGSVDRDTIYTAMIEQWNLDVWFDRRLLGMN